jgi:hypothetical protein
MPHSGGYLMLPTSIGDNSRAAALAYWQQSIEH